MERASAIREVLQSGASVADAIFDNLYPAHIRDISSGFWTPVEVALRASALLAPDSRTCVLDVGSGPGKICCVGALATEAWWHGVERDPDLVATAYATAISLQVDHRVSFSCCDTAAIDWRAFDSIYLFNPFEAVLFSTEADADPAERWRTFKDEVERTEQRLAELVTGTRVVTYHGFGGEVPDSFTLISNEQIGTDRLALWVKSSTAHRGQTWQI